MAPLSTLMAAALAASVAPAPMLALDAPPKIRLRKAPTAKKPVYVPTGDPGISNAKPKKKCLRYGEPCHVNSKYADPLGDFTKAQVQKAKHSSLLLTSTKDTSYKCSAVMISPAWALTAKHCLENGSVENLRAVLHDEYTAATVDTSSRKRDSNRREFLIVVLQQGKDADWALVNLMSHLPPDTKHYPKLANRKPNKDEKTLAIHHPKGEPTQGSSGKVEAIDQNNPNRPKSKSVATDWFKVKPGSSGGGVFDKDGKLIGIVGGQTPGTGAPSYFTQMTTIIAESPLVAGHLLVQDALP